MAYWAKAVRFDGTNDYLTRGADLTGVVDGKQGIFSCWVEFKDTNLQKIIDTFPDPTDGGIQIVRRASADGNVLRIYGESAGVSVGVLDIRSTNAYTLADGLVHVLASWDLANGVSWLYVSDVSDANKVSNTNANIDYTTGEFTIGADRVDQSNKLNADIADLYLNLSTHLDLSVEANRRKFIDASGNPVDLGEDGSVPTGFAPAVFLSGAADTWHTNKGTGGGFTENGALVEAMGPTGYGLNADIGDYDLTGRAAALQAARKIGAGAGSFSLTGQDATLNYGFTIGAEAGSYGVTGQDAGLRPAWKLPAGVGAYALTGKEAGLEGANPAEGGVYALTGQDIGLLYTPKRKRIRLTGRMDRTVYLTGRRQTTVQLQR